MHLFNEYGSLDNSEDGNSDDSEAQITLEMKVQLGFWTSSGMLAMVN